MIFRHITLAQNHMKTTFTFVISTEPRRLVAAEQALREAHDLVVALENELSEFLPLSPIYQLNTAEVGVPVRLSPAALDLLKICDRLSEQTERAFDCTAKSPREAIGHIAWDAETGTATRLHPAVHVGFGAVGKGYALDRVRSLIEQAGFLDFLLNAGGSSIVMSGQSSPGQPWAWGWSWFRDDDGDPAGLSFRHPTTLPVAIGVSGLHEKGNHLIDPATGQRVGGLLSALVAENSATEADALSTALFVGGWEKSMERFQQLTTPPAIAVIDGENIPRWNGTFQKLWGAIVSLACFFLCHFARADEGAIDLNDLGVEDFSPYIFDRNNWWILAPAAMLLVIVIHLKDSRPKNRPQTNLSEENDEAFHD